MLREKLEQFRVWRQIHVPCRTVKVSSGKNEYVWALQWRFNKPWIINPAKRLRVWLYWNIHYYKQEGVKLTMKARGIGLGRRAA